MEIAESGSDKYNFRIQETKYWLIAIGTSQPKKIVIKNIPLRAIQVLALMCLTWSSPSSFSVKGCPFRLFINCATPKIYISYS